LGPERKLVVPTEKLNILTSERSDTVKENRGDALKSFEVFKEKVDNLTADFNFTTSF